MKRAPRRTFFALFAFALTTATFAAERSNPNVEPVPVDPDRPSPPEHEKRWCVGANIGYGFASYSGELKDDIHSFTQNFDGKRGGAVSFDAFFGWRLSNRKTVIGPALSIFFDSYRADFHDNLDLTTYILAFTVQHFFSGDIHRGFFARIDAGLADTSLTYGSYQPHSNGSSSSIRDYGGTAVRVGLGYSIPLGSKFGVPLRVDWQSTSSHGDTNSNAVIGTAGFTF